MLLPLISRSWTVQVFFKTKIFSTSISSNGLLCFFYDLRLYRKKLAWPFLKYNPSMVSIWCANSSGSKWGDHKLCVVTVAHFFHPGAVFSTCNSQTNSQRKNQNQEPKQQPKPGATSSRQRKRQKWLHVTAERDRHINQNKILSQYSAKSKTAAINLINLV